MRSGTLRQQQQQGAPTATMHCAPLLAHDILGVDDPADGARTLSSQKLYFQPGVWWSRVSVFTRTPAVRSAAASSSTCCMHP